MMQPGTHRSRSNPVRQPVLLGLFTGTALGLGYLLAGVPNVELVSLVVALSGAVLGPVAGLGCGLLTGTIFSLANPLGMAPPLLVLAQALGQGMIALAGWLVGRALLARPTADTGLGDRFAALGAGLIGTLVYDLLTLLASWVLFPEVALPVLLANSATFVLLHTGVNAAIFFLLFSHLARRLSLLARTSLVGKVGVWPVVFLLFLTPGFSRAEEPATTPLDSLATVEADSLVADPVSPPELHGPELWKRPLWDPFSSSLLSHLDKRSAWIPVTDGGLGSSSLLLGEGSTEWAPVILRDGLPEGTGHRMTDDLWLASSQGLSLSSGGYQPLFSGRGVVDLQPMDMDPTKAMSYYRGLKGPHESYMRGISLLTPKTSWRLGFDFEETIDRLGYNWTESIDTDFTPLDVPRGNATLRRSRTRVVRHLDEDSSFNIEYQTLRQSRDEPPVLGADVLEIWGDGARADSRGRLGSMDLRASFFWENRTVEWGDASVSSGSSGGRRKIETGREGLLLNLRHAPRDSSDQPLNPHGGPSLEVLLSRWDVLDNAYGLQDESWPDVSGDRLAASMTTGTALVFASTRIRAGMTADFLEEAGVRPGAYLGWAQDGDLPVWSLMLESAGRAPRSDELLTPLTHHVLGRELLMRPNADLEHEKLLRASVLLRSRVLGFDLALDAAARRLRQGITWVADSEGALEGTWNNALDMNSTRVTASLAREGRFLGWGRARLEGTWQQFDEWETAAAFLPPEQYLRMELMWEQHFFQEDGILQLALLSTHRGAMEDPWDPTGQVVLPAGTSHDLLVGFRLVGAHLSLNFRNVTGQRTRLSAATLSPGREMDMRLHWVFDY